MTVLTRAGKLTFSKVTHSKRIVRSNSRKLLERVAPNSIIKSDNDGCFIEIDKETTGVILLNFFENIGG